jgi:CO/xanthine dehydrogenase FAD-binding subunit
MRRFDYSAPEPLSEALSIIQERGGGRLLAGGTDLVIQMREAGLRIGACAAWPKHRRCR